jgi:hypothetical protein
MLEKISVCAFRSMRDTQKWSKNLILARGRDPLVAVLLRADSAALMSGRGENEDGSYWDERDGIWQWYRTMA